MPDPVIILAPPRSFTSVVCAMLGQHPQMFGLQEVNLFAAETLQEREGLISKPRWSEHGLLRAVAQLYAGKQTAQTIALAQRWLDSRRNSSCVSVFRELANKVHPRILVDKSPRTVLQCEYMQRVLTAFPETRFLFLTRHPRPQGESVWNLTGGLGAKQMGALDYSTDPPTIDFQKSWFRMNINIITFLNGLDEGQWMHIRGEDLLSDPEHCLKKIVDWLGLRNDAEAIEAMKHPEESPFACFGPANARLGNDPSFLRDPALRPYSTSKKPRLEGPLAWREDGEGFSLEVKALARELGYS